jgi:glycosyltransferase involved in cell wall biosynthesis
MRIALLGPAWPHRGGIVHYTACLDAALRDRHEVHLISSRRQGVASLLRRDDQDRSEVALRPPAEPLLDFWNPLTWRRAARHVAALRPDLVLVSYWSPIFSLPYAAAARWARPRARTVTICHNVLPHDRTPLDPALARFCLGGSHAFLVPTTEQQRSLETLLPGARAVIAPHPTYGADLFPAGPARAEARARLGLPEGPCLLFFGNVRRYKGLPVLLEALALLKPERRVRLVVAGEFYQDLAETRALIRRLELEERVLLLDRYLPNEEVGLWFSAADAAVFPYLSASGSGALTVALGQGAPFVASDLPAFREAVRDRETGLFFPPGNPLALAAALERFYDEGWGPKLRATLRGGAPRIGWDSLARAVERAAGLPHREAPSLAER